MTKYPSVLALLLLTIAIAGCLTRKVGILVPCTISGAVYNVKQSAVDQVDVLFVVDNSNSMSEEQKALRDQIPRLVQVLTTGNIDTDPELEFPPVADLHVGIVSTDLGVGVTGTTPRGCDVLGDEASLRSQSASMDCTGTYPKVFEFRPEDGTDPAQFATDVGCVATLGIGGCGFEQQLEATLRAVTPSTTEITFFGNARGQADIVNTGFLRPTSLLAVILVTDEEDCSTTDSGIFDASSPMFPDDRINLRCTTYDSVLQRTERYVEGLLALRPDHPDLVVFAPIVGVPPELVADVRAIDYDAILADPSMAYRPDTAGVALVPSCHTDSGVAYPPRRIVEVAKGLEAAGASTVVQSICQEDFRPALDAILEKIKNVLSGTCLARPLRARADGTVACDVVETLPLTGAITSCDQLSGVGRERVRFEESGAETCRVRQVRATREVPATSAGWFYDTFSDDVLERCQAAPQRVSFTSGAEPIPGSEVRIECLQTGGGSTPGEVEIGSPCDTNADCAADGMPRLFCEGQVRECQLGCQNDTECPAGLACDDTHGPGFCRSPTCGG